MQSPGYPATSEALQNLDVLAHCRLFWRDLSRVVIQLRSTELDCAMQVSTLLHQRREEVSFEGQHIKGGGTDWVVDTQVWKGGDHLQQKQVGVLLLAIQ